MHDQHHDHHTPRSTSTATSAQGGASNGVGRSAGRSNADSSAPGVAEEELRHEGVPEQEGVGDAVDSAQASSAVACAADEAALYRVARRREASSDGQRKKRVDARYSVDEKSRILAKAKSLHITGAHLVGAVVMAFVNGEEHLPAQRTVYDDTIDELAALRAQIARMGNNVNQIARRLNSGGDPHTVDAVILDRSERLLTTARNTVRAVDEAAFRAAEGKGGRA
ncbi:MobC family plasmid mobilization relaxosome protein [Streptomyces sp. bgisy100]|uniref:MobC family plasmid mobilization relaxosome protein n=1 Tax=Streptomyces sp. bgisy100 TaxID=3413783 RepID=UPI003D720266